MAQGVGVTFRKSAKTPDVLSVTMGGALFPRAGVVVGRLELPDVEVLKAGWR